MTQNEFTQILLNNNSSDNSQNFFEITTTSGSKWPVQLIKISGDHLVVIKLFDKKEISINLEDISNIDIDFHNREALIKKHIMNLNKNKSLNDIINK